MMMIMHSGWLEARTDNDDYDYDGDNADNDDDYFGAHASIIQEFTH